MNEGPEEKERKGEKGRKENTGRARDMLWLSLRARTRVCTYTRLNTTHTDRHAHRHRDTWYRRITQSWAGLCSLAASISPSPLLRRPWTRGAPSRAFLPFFRPCAPRHFEPFLYTTRYHEPRRGTLAIERVLPSDLPVQLCPFHPSPLCFFASQPCRLKARSDLAISEG